MKAPNVDAPSTAGRIAPWLIAAALALAACARGKDSTDHQATGAEPPSQTTASAPGPSVDGVQAPPHGQPENGAATVNDKVVRR